MLGCMGFQHWLGTGALPKLHKMHGRQAKVSQVRLLVRVHGYPAYARHRNAADASQDAWAKAIE